MHISEHSDQSFRDYPITHFRNASAEVLHTLCHCVYAHCYTNQQNDQPNTERRQWKKTHPLAMKDNTLLF